MDFSMQYTVLWIIYKGLPTTKLNWLKPSLQESEAVLLERTFISQPLVIAYFSRVEASMGQSKRDLAPMC